MHEAMTWVLSFLSRIRRTKKILFSSGPFQAPAVLLCRQLLQLPLVAVLQCSHIKMRASANLQPTTSLMPG